MSYPINSDAVTAGGKLNDISINLDSFKDVVKVDDDSLDFGPVIEKIKGIIEETQAELANTEDIEDC